MKVNIEIKNMNFSDPVESILRARGLSQEWLAADKSYFLDGHTLKNYEKAKSLLLKHLNKNSRIGILVD